MEHSIVITITLSSISILLMIWVVVAQIRGRTKQRADVTTHKVTNHPSLEARIAEANAYLNKQKIRTVVYKYSSTTIKLITLVLGVLLSTSLVESSLSHLQIGLCGLLVVTATLFDYLFRPSDRWKRNARNEARIQAKIRNIEDDLAFSKSQNKIPMLTKELTALINDIQSNEGAE